MKIAGDGLALLAGLAFPLAFAPFEQHWLAVAALALLFGAWHKAGPRRAAWRGYLFGLGQFGVGVSWVYISLHDFGGASPVAAGLLTVLFVAFFALYPALAGYLACRWSAPAPALRLLVVFPAVWVLVEWLRGWFLTGFPWLQTGYSQIATPLGKLAPLAGVYGIGWLAAWVAACLAAFACLRGAGRRLWPIAAGLLCLGLAKSSTPSWTQPAGPAFPVALIQGNIEQQIKWQPGQQWRTLERYVGLTQAHWDAKVIVWPETAVPAFYHLLADTFFARLAEAAQRHGSDLLIGVPVGASDGSDQYYNGLASVGATPAIYRKRHLVPFGEFLPLKSVLGFVLEILQIPLSDFSAGAAQQPLLQAGGWPLLATVCYEDAFGNEGRIGLPEAAYLVNVSNDAWFAGSIAPHQHLQIAQMRALETGRYMLRATNTGITTIIGPDGQVLRQLPQFQADALTGEIQPMAGATPYVRYGDAPAIGLLGLLWAGGLLAGRLKRHGGIEP
jgi:apolipoprotein N-acyltransferase